MMMISKIVADTIVKKYWSIIQEEVNVKQVTVSEKASTLTTQYVPLWQMISPVYGKDTSRIIAAAKAWQTEFQENGILLVRDDVYTRSLDRGMYEIRYFGYDEHYETVEDGIVVWLDLTITEELKEEGVIRELSRFLNQMRKDAWCRIDERLRCILWEGDVVCKHLCKKYESYLKQEALLCSLEEWETNETSVLFSAQFVSDDCVLDITLASC